MDKDRLKKQIEFIVEIDKLKQVYRQTLLTDGSRRENSAEHSWHLAVMAMLLAEHAAQKGLDMLKVIKMLLIHDLVEIDAGDTFCYDEAGRLDKDEREQRAADRLFGLLPPDQGHEFRALWDEFEKRETPEACFAASLDRFQPLLHNYHTKGHTWVMHDVRSHRVIERNRPLEKASPALWDCVQKIIEDSIRRGYLKR